MLTVGSSVAGYRIERVLGTGGMGTVYLVANPELPRREALKVLSAELSRDAGFRSRFIREADVASRLEHPNIVSVRADKHPTANCGSPCNSSTAPTPTRPDAAGR